MTSTTLESLFAAMPANGDSSVGAVARKALVSRLQGATPGSHSEPFGASGPSFLSLFFQGYTAAEYCSEVDSVYPGMNWSGFAVAVLCEAMYNLTSELRGQLNIGAIQNDINTYNQSVNQSAVAWYARVFARSYQPFASALSQAPSSEWQQLATEYQGKMTSEPWLGMKLAEYNSQQWTDREWELFHHWVKLSILGANDAEIGTTISTIAAKGIPVQGVEAASWRQYMAWLGSGTGGGVNLQAGDVEAQASNGILEQECMAVPGGQPSCMDEENSFEFTSDGQPGNGYRESPGGSCFSGETRIALPDGSRARIDSVRAGETVATPRGPRRVILVARPARHGRPLWSLDGRGFRFTRSHPFFRAGTGDREPRLAAISPAKLASSVATAADGGIAKLEEGIRLASWEKEEVGELTVRSVECTTPAEGTDATLYDLVLEDFGPYLAGDDDCLLLAGSEVPDPAAAGYAVLVATLALRAAAPAIEAALAEVPPEEVAQLQDEASRRVSAGLLRNAIAAIDPEEIEAARAAGGDGGDPHRLAAGLIDLFTDEDSYRRVTGQALEWISGSHGDELRSAVEMGWRRCDRDGEGRVLAVSLHDAHTHPPAVFPSPGPGFEVSVNGEKRILGGQSRRPASAFARPLDEVTYFDDWRKPGSDGDPRLRFETEIEPQRLVGELPLSPRLVGRHRLFRVPLRDRDRVEHGWISVDLRLLGPEQAKQEQAAAESWDDRARVAFAVRLGEELGSAIAERFGPSLEYARAVNRARAAAQA